MKNDIAEIKEDIKDIKKDIRDLLEHKWKIETSTKIAASFSGIVSSILVGVCIFYFTKQ